MGKKKIDTELKTASPTTENGPLGGGRIVIRCEQQKEVGMKAAG